MSIHRQETIIEAPSGEGHPLDRMRLFYEANGYVVQPRIEQEGGERLVFERGERGAGWWSSDMTRLWVSVSVTWQAEVERVHVSYEVETTGQHMAEEEAGYWREEMEQGRAYLLAAPDTRPPPDLRPAEQRRARQAWRGTWRMSLYAFLFTFVMLFALVVLLTRMGWLELF